MHNHIHILLFLAGFVSGAGLLMLMRTYLYRANQRLINMKLEQINQEMSYVESEMQEIKKEVGNG